MPANTEYSGGPGSPGNVLLIPRDMSQLAKTGSLPLSQHIQFGPESMWRGEIGDLRMFFTIFGGGLLQLAHPVLGDAIATQSGFFDDTWSRVDRSARGISEIFTSDNATAAGHRIRDYHSRITGRDEHGTEVSALDPETYTWGWLTIMWSAEQRRRRFERPQLSPEEWESWYQEGKVGYRCQGVSDKFLPPTYPEYQAYFEEICHTRLQRTPAFNHALNQLETGSIDRPPQVPPQLWSRFAQGALSNYLHLLAVGGLPETIRDKFNIPMSKTAQITLRGLEGFIKSMWNPLAPEQLNYHPGLLRTIVSPRNRAQNVLYGLWERMYDRKFEDE